MKKYYWIYAGFGVLSFFGSIVFCIAWLWTFQTDYLKAGITLFILYGLLSFFNDLWD